MNPRWFWRMTLWVRNPPSKRRRRLVAGVLAVCAVLYGIEWMWGWPEWATVNKLGRKGF